jgi:hypothetical protein
MLIRPQAKALCKGHPNPEMWFPEPERFSKGDEDRLQKLHAVEALEICAECPIRQACLDKSFTSIDTIHYGIWGGFLPFERLKAIGRHTKDLKIKNYYQSEIRKLADKRGVPRYEIGKRSERQIWREDFYYDQESA